MVSSENAMLRGAVLFNVQGPGLSGARSRNANRKRGTSWSSRLPRGYYLGMGAASGKNQAGANRDAGDSSCPVVILIILPGGYTSPTALSRRLWLTLDYGSVRADGRRLHGLVSTQEQPVRRQLLSGFIAPIRNGHRNRRC
ncbi:MAG: hypothetical protein MZV63_44455 [Marinilabiliales bacterium]|nr:hypothetical protein [Marinilabiliales bacterium]